MGPKSNSRTRRFRGFRLCPGSKNAKDTLFRIQQRRLKPATGLWGNLEI